MRRRWLWRSLGCLAVIGAGMLGAAVGSWFGGEVLCDGSDSRELFACFWEGVAGAVIGLLVGVLPVILVWSWLERRRRPAGADCID